MKSAQIFKLIAILLVSASTAVAQYTPLGSAEKDLETYSKSEIRKALLEMGVDPEIAKTLKAGQRYNIGAYINYGYTAYTGLLTTASFFYYLTAEDNRVASYATAAGAAITLSSYVLARWMSYMANKRYREALDHYYSLQP